MSLLAKVESSCPRTFTARVTARQNYGDRAVRLTTRVDGLDVRCSPGQFLTVKAWPGHDPLLRRPLAPFDVHTDADGTTFELLLVRVGRGTTLLADLPIGSELSMLAPLGCGFSPLPKKGTVLAVGGGTGLAPFYHLAQNAVRAGRAGDLHLVLGGRSHDQLFGVERCQDQGVGMTICTDAGDTGLRGTALDGFDTVLASGLRPEVVYGCGPEPMLLALAQRLREKGLRAELSLERHMACGFGVCYTCVCNVVSADGSEHPVRVCTEGPVFPLEKLPANW